MIAPAFLIKILGCATVGAFVTIGIPIIVVKENEKKVVARQADIDKPATLSNLFASLASVLSDESKPASVIKAGEKFSDKAFTTWKPTLADINNIAKNWSGAIENMPNAFFIKLKDKNLTQGEGVCHIQTSGTTVSQQTNQSLYIPFLKSALKSTFKDTNNNHLFSVTAKGGQIDTHLGEDFLKKNKANFKKELKAISDGNQVPGTRVVGASGDTPNQQEQAIATDLLFLQTLYEDTITRLTKELGNPVTSPAGSARIWVPVSCS